MPPRLAIPWEQPQEQSREQVQRWTQQHREERVGVGCGTASHVAHGQHREERVGVGCGTASHVAEGLLCRQRSATDLPAGAFVLGSPSLTGTLHLPVCRQDVDSLGMWPQML